MNIVCTLEMIYLFVFEQVVFNYIRFHAQAHTASITTHCKWKILKNIKFVLSRCKMLKLFRRVVLGIFFNFEPNVVFNSLLFHAIMVGEIRVEGIGQYELWFGIGRGKARFSKQEFCLVTSLKFGYL